MKTIRYSNYPIFETLSWAITYHFGSQSRDKFYRDCDCIWPYDLLCDEEGIEPEPLPEWPVLEEVTLDGVTYYKIQIKDCFYWKPLPDLND